MQNNQEVRVAYFEVLYSATLQYHSTLDSASGGAMFIFNANLEKREVRHPQRNSFQELNENQGRKHKMFSFFFVPNTGMAKHCTMQQAFSNLSSKVVFYLKCKQ